LRRVGRILLGLFRFWFANFAVRSFLTFGHREFLGLGGSAGGQSRGSTICWCDLMARRALASWSPAGLCDLILYHTEAAASLLFSRSCAIFSYRVQTPKIDPGHVFGPSGGSGGDVLRGSWIDGIGQGGCRRHRPPTRPLVRLPFKRLGYRGFRSVSAQSYSGALSLGPG
jgi:hypothetical protein